MPANQPLERPLVDACWVQAVGEDVLVEEACVDVGLGQESRQLDGAALGAGILHEEVVDQGDLVLAQASVPLIGTTRSAKVSWTVARSGDVSDHVACRLAVLQVEREWQAGNELPTLAALAPAAANDSPDAPDREGARRGEADPVAPGHAVRSAKSGDRSSVMEMDRTCLA